MSKQHNSVWGTHLDPLPAEGRNVARTSVQRMDCAPAAGRVQRRGPGACYPGRTAFRSGHGRGGGRGVKGGPIQAAPTPQSLALSGADPQAIKMRYS